MARTVAESKVETDGQTAVITHCNNESFAMRLKQLLEERYSFAEVLVVPTRGLSSMYANEKGVILAF